MKRCPTCQKEFPDSMRFCQTDGTPLIDAAPAAATPEDPFKTVVGQTPPDDPFKTVLGGTQAKDNDVLQLPDEPVDPMKTMVVQPDDWKNAGASTSSSQTGSAPPEPPKFNEPDLSPPPFGDLSPQSPRSSTGDIFGSGSGSSSGTSPFDAPGTSPFGQPPSGSPFPSPFEQQKSSFEPPPSPFDAPPPPPFKEPESPFGGSSSGSGQQSPFDQSPFGAPSPSSPIGDPFGGAQPQTEWNPPPAPVQNWQDQNLGANTPFQPPAAAGGQNQTLAIVSLVSGILGLCCGILGIVALITGYIAKNNADTNPSEYGGRGLALAGMILGGISVFLMIIGIIIQVLGAFAR